MHDSSVHGELFRSLADKFSILTRFISSHAQLYHSLQGVLLTLSPVGTHDSGLQQAVFLSGSDPSSGVSW